MAINLSQTIATNNNQTALAGQASSTRACVSTESKPELISVNDRVNALIAAAKNIRAELKAAFPGVKFSVKSERFAGGNAIRVQWTDGPSTSSVTDITCKYEAGKFDGMTDYYTYESTEFTKNHGSAKYITESRELSLDFISKVIMEIGAKWHDGELPTAEQYKRGLLFSEYPSRHCDTWQQLIYRASQNI